MYLLDWTRPVSRGLKQVRIVLALVDFSSASTRKDSSGGLQTFLPESLSSFVDLSENVHAEQAVHRKCLRAIASR